MNLEQFVNVMGINVIRAIEKIQHVQECKERPVEPDDFINKNWYKEYLKSTQQLGVCKEEQYIKDAEATNEKIKDTESTNEKITYAESTNEKIIDAEATNEETAISETIIIPIPQAENDVHTCTKDRKEKVKQDLTKKACRSDVIANDRTTNLIEHSVALNPVKRNTEYLNKTKTLTNPSISIVTDILKPCKEKLKSYTLIKDKPLSAPIISFPKKAPNDNITDQINVNNNNTASARSNVWRRPRNIKWCTPKYFLSKRVKTYEEAEKIVENFRAVIEFNRNKKEHRDEERINLFQDDVISFLQPLYLLQYHKILK